MAGRRLDMGNSRIRNIHMDDSVGPNNHTRHLMDQDWCIWMAAGVISFKICPLGYDCDHCEFDRVIRQKQTSPLPRASRNIDDPNNPA